jgi:hypothetical protein
MQKRASPGEDYIVLLTALILASGQPPSADPASGYLNRTSTAPVLGRRGSVPFTVGTITIDLRFVQLDSFSADRRTLQSGLKSRDPRTAAHRI